MYALQLYPHLRLGCLNRARPGHDLLHRQHVECQTPVLSEYNLYALLRVRRTFETISQNIAI